MPTKTQWQGVIDNNTQSTVGTWSNKSTDYSSAKFFGDKLMLSAAGMRHTYGGSLRNRGARGSYWSSTELSSGGYAGFLHFHSSVGGTGGTGGTGNYYRSRGISIRCVAE